MNNMVVPKNCKLPEMNIIINENIINQCFRCPVREEHYHYKNVTNFLNCFVI